MSYEFLGSVAADGYIGKIQEMKDSYAIVNAEKDPKSFSFGLNVAKVAFPPHEAALFIIDVVNKCLRSQLLYQNALTVMQEIAPQLDLQKLISELPNEDFFARGLVISILPVPIDPVFINFIFDASISSFVLNRMAFLRYLERAMEYPTPEKYKKLICGVLESYSNDNSYTVRAIWVKPALHYLRQSTHLKGFLKRLLTQDNLYGRIALAMNFREAYKIVGDPLLKLLKDTDDKVIAAVIPNVVDCNLSKDQLSSLYLTKNTTIAVMVIRYLGNLTDDDIVRFLEFRSDEVNNELIKYLPNHKNPLPHLLEIMEFIQNECNGERFKWRTCYEILGLPIELLLQCGERGYEFVEFLVDKHPRILMNRAIDVFCQLIKEESSYVPQFMKRLEELKNDSHQFSQIAYTKLKTFQEENKI